MKQPNPLLPQGSFEAHARGKSHVRIAVFTILAIHVVVLGALLIQGCKRGDETVDDPTLLTETNDASAIPPFGSSNTDVVTPAGDTGAVPAFTAPPLPGGPGVAPATSGPVAPPLPAQLGQTSAPVLPPVAPPQPPAVDPTLTEPPAAPATTEHTIVRGDTFSGLAQRYGVTSRAIQNANPDVNPGRLKLGQKVKIPARTANGSTRVGTVSNGTATPDTYTVKSGDTLGRIATTHGTTVRAIQKLNNLSTTQIRVGQKLKLPPKAQAPAAATPNPVTPGGFTPPPPPVPVTPAPAQ